MEVMFDILKIILIFFGAAYALGLIIFCLMLIKCIALDRKEQKEYKKYLEEKEKMKNENL